MTSAVRLRCNVTPDNEATKYQVVEEGVDSAPNLRPSRSETVPNILNNRRRGKRRLPKNSAIRAADVFARSSAKW